MSEAEDSEASEDADELPMRHKVDGVYYAFQSFESSRAGVRVLCPICVAQFREGQLRATDVFRLTRSKNSRQAFRRSSIQKITNSQSDRPVAGAIADFPTCQRVAGRWLRADATTVTGSGRDTSGDVRAPARSSPVPNKPKLAAALASSACFVAVVC
mmetsp:Transcript_9047/g.23029  ORF Transcript_9047/g.23029 Transcript_9047/m.23029 type:complete len:157 (-) Transcript_9047:241-711(-)